MSNKNSHDYTTVTGNAEATVTGKTELMNDDERVKQEEKIAFCDDAPKDMSFERRWAMKMIDKKWYNPNAETTENDAVLRSIDDGVGIGNFRSKDGYPIVISKDTKPSLQRAWEFFDHVALPRYYASEEEEKEKGESAKESGFKKFLRGGVPLELDRARVGDRERKTKLYDPIRTSHSQLGDFGMGIGLYFSTLRGTGFMFTLLGFTSIFLMDFYAGDFSDGQKGLSFWQQGSAICTKTKWVPCPTCESGDSNLPLCKSTDGNIFFALRNDCETILSNEKTVLIITSLFVVAVVCYSILCIHLTKSKKQFDEDEQTTKDYSIIIKNPPSNAKDPEEWRTYFQQNFGATVVGCTVAVDNDLLVRALVKHRESMKAIELAVPPETKLDNIHLAKIAAEVELERSWLSSYQAQSDPGIPEHFQQVLASKGQVQGLAQLECPVTNVFITFETEADQRKVLEVFDFGAIHIALNNTEILPDPKYLFREDILLQIDEASEPDTILWDALNVDLKTKVKQHIISNGLLIILVSIVAVVVEALSNYTFLMALTIGISGSIYDSLVPIMSRSESHSSVGTKQTSIYFKVALFRIATNFLIAWNTPFYFTLDATRGIVTRMIYQFETEIFIVIIFNLFDPFGLSLRHYDAPRAKSQDGMNICMLGSEVTLANKYTDLSNIIVLAFFYSLLFPAGFFYCALCILIYYISDRYAVMRTWRKQPQTGSSVNEFFQYEYLPIALLGFYFFSLYYAAGFPFDGLCATNEVAPSSTVGEWNTTYWESDAEPSFMDYYKNNPGITCPMIPINEGEMVYKFCDQSIRSKINILFPSLFKEANNSGGVDLSEVEIEQFTNMFRLCFFSIIVGFVLTVVPILLTIRQYLMGDFKSKYLKRLNDCWIGTDSKGEEQGIKFSEATNVSLYIPQVHSLVYPCPLLACHVDNVDKSMIDWEDTEFPHCFYDLQKDARVLIGELDTSTNASTDASFSTVTHWPARALK